MGLLDRLRGKDEEDKNASEMQKEEVTRNDVSDPSPEIENPAEEEEETKTINSDNNTEDSQIMDNGEIMMIDTIETVEQEELVGEKEVIAVEEIELTAEKTEEVAEEVEVLTSEEKDVSDLPEPAMEDMQDAETERVDSFYDPSKKQYSKAKLNILENRLKTLLQKEKQLLVHPNPDTKKLEELALDIQHIKCELDDAKYEACRFSSEAQ